MLSSEINQVVVVSLPDDKERRAHIRQHFSEIGINHFQFIDGVDYQSDAVKQFYVNGRVKSFPNCFRCNQPLCECANNVFIPQQIANWLVFEKVWANVAKYKGLSLVCEDDVWFYPGAMNLLSQALREIETSTEKPLLIRLAHSGLASDISLKKVTTTRLTNKVVMSNVAFIMNAAMATYLLSNFNSIETTSDIFIHSQMANKGEVIAYTVEPLLATDLSFNKSYAKFISRIHPKGLNEEDTIRMQSHIKRVDSTAQYHRVLEQWLNSCVEDGLAY
jgi:GR25 family glycosyltransferase involved in LPS biosynthesis